MRFSDFDEEDILLLDMTHGGVTLAEALYEEGADVTIIDLYGTLRDTQMKKLLELGIGRFCGVKSDSSVGRCAESTPGTRPTSVNWQMMESSIDTSMYDLIVSPVHSPVLNPIIDDGKIVSHHEIVGALIDHVKIPIIEITGVRGKTSTASILGDILIGNGKKIVSSTSLGVYYADQKGKKKIGRPSITPANAINVVRLAEDFDVDVLILETSLGFTGAADINIMTSMENDYQIAGGRLSAVQSKVYTTRYLKHTLVLDEDTYNKYAFPIIDQFPEGVVGRFCGANDGRFPEGKSDSSIGRCAESTSERPSGTRPTSANLPTVGRFRFTESDSPSANLPTVGRFRFTESDSPSANLPSIETIKYRKELRGRISKHLFGIVRKNIPAAISAALRYGIPRSRIESSLGKSSGVPGRMRSIRSGDLILIDNSNPATDHISLRNAIEDIRMEDIEDEEILVILGGRESSCVDTDYSALKETIERYNGIDFFLTGEIGRKLREIGIKHRHISKNKKFILLNL
jgi:UDP-N-acetylmuramoylalanine-D-glutamate ligase